MNNKKILLGLLIGLFLVNSFVFALLFAGTIDFDKEYQRASSSKTYSFDKDVLEIPVSINVSENVYAYSFDLLYDHSAIIYNRAVFSDFAEGWTRVEYEPDKNRTVVMATNFGNVPGKSGEWELVKLYFNTTEKTGEYTITIDNLQAVKNDNGNLIGLELTSERVNHHIFVTETIADINNDKKVNLNDLVLVALSMWTKIGDDSFNWKTDLDNNGIINIFDLARVGLSYGYGW